jgi:hypothetical protein
MKRHDQPSIEPDHMKNTLPLTPFNQESVFELSIIQGYFRNLESESLKKRSGQWGAIITRHSRSSGGFERTFLEQGDNGYLKLSNKVLPSTFLELCEGKGSARRRGFYRVLARTHDTITIEEITKDQVSSPMPQESDEAIDQEGYPLCQDEPTEEESPF